MWSWQRVHELARRAGIFRTGAAIVAFLVPIGLYASWYHADRHRYALEGADGLFLYGRVAIFADCSGLNLPVREVVLCDFRPEADRPSPNEYIWGPHSPVEFLHMGSTTRKNSTLLHFALRIIAHQP